MYEWGHTCTSSMGKRVNESHKILSISMNKRCLDRLREIAEENEVNSNSVILNEGMSSSCSERNIR